MATHGYQTLVKGEASETDDEEEMYVTSVPSGVCGVRVLGEASETDEEEEGEVEMSSALGTDLPPLVVTGNEGEASPVGMEEKPTVQIRQRGRYSTLLQQRLVECNARLHHDVSHSVRQVYRGATAQIQALTGQLSNSQSGIISASHSIRLALEDLRRVSERIDIITACSLLPAIRI